MTIWIFTGGRPSNSAKELSNQQGFKRTFYGKMIKPKDTVVNWGTTKATGFGATQLNQPEAVKRATNKYFAFSAMAGQHVNTVPWTANAAVAKEWQKAGSVIVARTVLTGHSGNGIIIVEKGEELPEAPLYTKYIFKTKEYRVHATREKVIDTQRKVRDPDVEPKSWKVRSHENGFVFQRNGIQESVARDALAIQAVTVLGLDFGAVDIVEDKNGDLFVLEVNTAPGLEGQTIETYATAIRELVEHGKAA